MHCILLSFISYGEMPHWSLHVTMQAQRFSTYMMSLAEMWLKNEKKPKLLHPLFCSSGSLKADISVLTTINSERTTKDEATDHLIEGLDPAKNHAIKSVFVIGRYALSANMKKYTSKWLNTKSNLHSVI